MVGDNKQLPTCKSSVLNPASKGIAFLSTKHESDASKREPSADFVYTLQVAKFTEVTEFH